MVCLYFFFPGATWVEDEELGPCIGKLLPKYNVWALDKQWNVKIERHGFFIASDFSGTAHSFQGANLQAAIIDCNGWDSGQNKPTKKESWPLAKIRLTRQPGTCTGDSSLFLLPVRKKGG